MLNDFIRYIQNERRYSPLTVKNYRRDIERFVRWCEENESMRISPFKAEEVEAGHIREWIYTRTQATGHRKGKPRAESRKLDLDGEPKAANGQSEEEQPKRTEGSKDEPHGRGEVLSAASLNRELASLRSFFRYLQRTERIARNPMQGIRSLKTPKRLPSFVPESRMRNLLHEEELPPEPTASEEAFLASRDRLIIRILYGCGIRLAELIRIDIDHFEQEFRALRVVGKGNKERLVPIVEPLRRAILEHISLIERQNICKNGEKALFLTQKGGRISRIAVYRIVNRTLKEGGVQGKRSPHVLRHTFATHLLNHGADMREIQELMGHSSLQATQVYTHNSIAQLQKIYHEAHPREGKRPKR